MLDILERFWYIWMLVLLAAIYRVFKPTIKGWFGEKKVARHLRRLSEEYTVLNDVILPTETGTTQIESIYPQFVKQKARTPRNSLPIFKPS